jgi:hypothetical protein
VQKGCRAGCCASDLAASQSQIVDIGGEMDEKVIKDRLRELTQRSGLTLANLREHS